MSLITRFRQHIQNLPERELTRLKERQQNLINSAAEKAKEAAEGVLNVTAEVESKESQEPKIPEVKTSFSDWTIFGSLNSAKFYAEMSHERRFSISAVPNHFASSLTSLAAIPALVVLKVALSALVALKDLFLKKSLTDATDPLLRNSLDLAYAIKQTFFGALVGVAKLAVSLFTDSYQLYKEYQEKKAHPNGRTLLVVVDVQKTFLPKEADLKEGYKELPVDGGNSIIPNVNKLINAFKALGKLVAASLDYHGSDHKSFAINSGLGFFAQATMAKVKGVLTLWAAHGVKGTRGAEFAEGINPSQFDLIIHKGTDRDEECYGGFAGVKGTQTKLKEFIKSKNIKKVVVCGLATDYCVEATAIQARDLGLITYLVVDASKGIFKNAQGKVDDTLKVNFFTRIQQESTEKGSEGNKIRLVKTDDVIANLNQLSQIQQFAEETDIQ